MSGRVKSYDIAGQGIGPALLTQHLCTLSLLNIFVPGSKVPSSLKTTIHETFSFWYHINKNHIQRSTSML